MMRKNTFYISLSSIFNKFFSIDYNKKLVEMMIHGVLGGAITVNIIVAFFITVILYDYLSFTYLLVWFSSHITVFFLRVLVREKLSAVLDNPNKIKKYLLLYMTLLFLSSLLYSHIFWVSVVNSIPDIYLFIMGTVFIAMTSGAVTTLGSVYHSFVIFVVSLLIPSSIVLTFYDGEAYTLLTIILEIYTFLLLVVGYSQYKNFKKIVSLEETFQTIYDKSSDAIVILNKNKVQDCNTAAVHLFKFSSKKDLLSVELSKLSPQTQQDGMDSIQKMHLLFTQTFQDGSNIFEWLHINNKGEKFWCEIVLTKIELNSQEVIHGVWRDISFRKQLELENLEAKENILNLNKNLESKIDTEVAKNREKDKQILQQSRLAQMGEMIGMIAHQWRQPLAAISATSSSIKLKATLGKLEPTTAIELSTKISEYSQHLSTTIDDFRDFFRPNKEKRETSFSELVQSVLAIVATSIQNKNIKIIKDLECDDRFYSYPNELKQVILNLIKNAEDILLEKELENKFIKIKCYKEKENMVLEVSDNGGGVPKLILDKVFDPYFSTKKEKDGTGLGLYMSKTIIQTHCNGELSVRNDEQGAIFSISLGVHNG